MRENNTDKFKFYKKNPHSILFLDKNENSNSKIYEDTKGNAIFDINNKKLKDSDIKNLKYFKKEDYLI